MRYVASWMSPLCANLSEILDLLYGIVDELLDEICDEVLGLFDELVHAIMDETLGLLNEPW